MIAAVAIATAILTGALLVGASMRSSLRSLALARLGSVDSLMISSGFFRRELVDEFQATPGFSDQFDSVHGAILIPSAAIESAGTNLTGRSSGISVWGIGTNFEQLFAPGQERWMVPTGDQVVLTRTLARELGIDESKLGDGQASVTIRMTRPSRLAGDSALGKKKDLTTSLVRLSVTGIADDAELGGIGMWATQGGIRNAFVSLATLQAALDEPSITVAAGQDFANVILLGTKTPESGSDDVKFGFLRKNLKPRPADLGLDVHPVMQQFGARETPETVRSYSSLTTAQLVFDDKTAEVFQNAFPDATPVSTYLFNSVRLKGTDESTNDAILPYSMFSAIDFGPAFPIESPDGAPLELKSPNDLILNEWTASNLGAVVGDTVVVKYFEPESTHGQSMELVHEFRVAGIAKLTEPAEPFRLRGRNELIPSRFDKAPTLANDPDLTPHVPGMTDSQSIEDWDVPFDMTERIRPVDDEYWNSYRTTPKGFVSLEKGKGLWSSRFGTITGFRIPENVNVEDVRKEVVRLWQQGEIDGGLHFVPLRNRTIRASSGTTPFDGLFLGLSLFIIVAALLLVMLLFRLGLDERIRQVGTLAAVGFTSGRITRLWLGEATLLATAGAVMGAVLGIGWAALMIYGLTTWWVAAIGQPFLRLQLDPISIVLGAVLGIAAALLTTILGIRQISKQPAAQLLSGRSETGEIRATGHKKSFRWMAWMPYVLLVAALVLSVAGQQLSGDNQAGAFMGGGFLVLTALLMLVRRWIATSTESETAGVSSIPALARSSLLRNPLRSTLTVSLVAVATFLVVAISAFRLAPSDQSSGGIDFVATSAQPIFADLNGAGGQKELLGKESVLDPATRIYSFRLQAGDDASCNNVYQSSRPQVLGVPNSWIERFDTDDSPRMRWAGSSANSTSLKKNPWRLLDGTVEKSLARTNTTDENEMIVDAVIDKNTAWYSLKVYTIGGLFPVEFESGLKVRFRVVGFLDNSLLQGSLLIGESDFERLFPAVSGYRFFLVDTPAAHASAENGDQDISRLERGLADQGFDARSSTSLLERFMSVQNTYLSAFQSLGGLGLLLGTLGLAAVMFRNIVGRRAELAVMRCVGFAPRKLAEMILIEQAWLLGLGLLVGIVAAAFCTLPHIIAGGASVPWSGLTLILAGVVLAGLITGLFVARKVISLPVIASLRSG